MTVLQFAIKAVVESRAAVVGLLINPGDAVLIQRGVPRWLIMKCPCGCGEEIPINLDTRAGKAWRLYLDAKYGSSLFPSVWRDTGCEAHFIIRRNKIYLFEKIEEDFASPQNQRDLEALAQRVIDFWPVQGFVRFADAAEALSEVPWDVLDACGLLVKTGALLEGSGSMRAAFRRP